MLILPNQIKRFIETHIELIESEKFSELYAANNTSTPDGFITQALISAGINPLTGMNYISDSMFYKVENMPFLDMPDSIFSIDAFAFYKCKDLQSIRFSTTLYEIGKQAFEQCEMLDNLVFPDSLGILTSTCFHGCKNLSNVSIGNHMLAIGPYVFYSCPKLKEIKFRGTILEWNRIEKNSHWLVGSSIEKIICSDGVVKVK